jgi:archaemetzincin
MARSDGKTLERYMRLQAWMAASFVWAFAAAAACSKPAPPSLSSSSSVDASLLPDGGTPTLAWRLYEDPSMFTWKLKPRPDDWLAKFHEPGQTFSVYERTDPVRPTEARKKLVLQPLGTLRAEDQKLLEKLKEHLGLFYVLPVEMREAIPFPASITHRTRKDGTPPNERTWVQYQTDSIMDEILKKRLPNDAVVYLGVTTSDLYPQDSWNFVFGQARFDERVGVYSLARMFESFNGGTDTDASRIRGLARSTAILSHEAGHAFGIAHCTRFECVMNGSNSLDELDRQFAEPCPVCLRKLSWNIGFDPIKRYQALNAFYRREHIDTLATWIDRRLEQLAPLN